MFISNDKEAFSFLAGLIVGARWTTLVKTPNIRVGVTTPPKRKQTNIGAKNVVTLSLGKKEGERGQSVNIPVYLSNNDPTRIGNAIGVGGFILDIRFNPDYVQYTGYSKVDWDGSVTVDTSNVASGVLKLMGLRTSNFFGDCQLLNLSFFVKSTVPETVTSIELRLAGSAGTGLGTEVLFVESLGDDEYQYYYVQPSGKESGSIELEGIDIPKYSAPISDSQYGLIGGGTSIVDFTLNNVTVIGPGGIGGGDGSGGWSGTVNATIVVWFNGQRIGSYTIKLQRGTHSYSGRFPIYVPSSGYGDIEFTIEIEPEEGEEDVPFYVLIPAFSFKATITSDIDREDQSDIPTPDVKPRLYEVVIGQEYIYIYQYSVAPPASLSGVIESAETVERVTVRQIQTSKLAVIETMIAVELARLRVYFLPAKLEGAIEFAKARDYFNLYQLLLKKKALLEQAESHDVFTERGVEVKKDTTMESGSSVEFIFIRQVPKD